MYSLSGSYQLCGKIHESNYRKLNKKTKTWLCLHNTLFTIRWRADLTCGNHTAWSSLAHSGQRGAKIEPSKPHNLLVSHSGRKQEPGELSFLKFQKYNHYFTSHPLTIIILFMDGLGSTNSNGGDDMISLALPLVRSQNELRIIKQNQETISTDNCSLDCLSHYVYVCVYIYYVICVYIRNMCLFHIYVLCILCI